MSEDTNIVELVVTVTCSGAAKVKDGPVRDMIQEVLDDETSLLIIKDYARDYNLGDVTVHRVRRLKHEP